jgi:hypothetical protein
MAFVHFLCGKSLWPEDNVLAEQLLKGHIVGKRVLVVPAYATSAFFLKQIGAAGVVGADIDPVSVAWLQQIANYYHHQQLGATWLGMADIDNMDFSAIARLRGRYPGVEADSLVIEQLIEAVRGKVPPSPIEGVAILQAAIGPVPAGLVGVKRVIEKNGMRDSFNFIYVPHLFGEENGIIDLGTAVAALEELWLLGKAGAAVMIAPETEVVRQALNSPSIKGRFSAAEETHYYPGGVAPEVVLWVKK